MAWRRSVAALAAIVAVVLAWAAINVTAFAEGIWLSAALPITAAGPPAILFGAVQIWLHRRRAHYFARQSKLLQHVQAPGLGAFLARNPDFLSEPVRQDAAIVFIDISGFTGLSETLGPNAVRELLDGFYRSGRRGGHGKRRRHHQLHGRRRDGAVRPAAMRPPMTPSMPPAAPSGSAVGPATGSRHCRRQSRRGSDSRSARISAPSLPRGSAARTSRSPRPAIPSTWQAV